MAYRELPAVKDLNEAGDLTAPPNTREWAIAARAELRLCISGHQSNSSLARSLVEMMQHNHAYQLLHDAHGEPFISWRAFCTHKRPWGLEYDPEMIDLIVAEDAKERLRELPASRQKAGRPEKAKDDDGEKSTGSVDLPKNDSTAGIVRRLKRDNPELAEKVIDGEISAAAAAEQARFKWAKRRAINLEDAASAAATIIKYTNPDYIEHLIELLENHLTEVDRLALQRR